MNLKHTKTNLNDDLAFGSIQLLLDAIINYPLKPNNKDELSFGLIEYIVSTIENASKKDKFKALTLIEDAFDINDYAGFVSQDGGTFLDNLDRFFDCEFNEEKTDSFVYNTIVIQYYLCLHMEFPQNQLSDCPWTDEEISHFNNAMDAIKSLTNTKDILSRMNLPMYMVGDYVFEYSGMRIYQDDDLCYPEGDLWRVNRLADNKPSKQIYNSPREAKHAIINNKVLF